MTAPGRFAEVLASTDLLALRASSLASTHAEVERALATDDDSLSRFAALLSPVAGDHYLEALAQASHRLTVQRFGRVLQMYAPLYISNECIDTCTYCGFSRENDIHRITLTTEAAAREAAVLLEEGFRHLLLVSGEHPRLAGTGHLRAVVARLRDEFASIGIEVAPQSEESYRELVEAGVDSLSVYQETYDREAYARVHLAGKKKNFDWRLATPERAARAGLKRIGIGALLGLADPRFDAMATFLHARFLQKDAWRAQISVSLPRLQPAMGAIGALHPVDDRFLVQFVCALRLCLPDLGLVLSTREPAALRDGLVRLGITQLSAGSRTEPGGYENPDEAAEQFEVGDHRSSRQVAEQLRSLGYAVVWKDWEAVLHGQA